MPRPLPPPDYWSSPCIVDYCKANQQHVFFCVPGNEELRDKWLINMNRSDLIGSNYNGFKNRRVCQLHFSGKCFFKNPIRLRLQRGSIPTILNPSAENEIDSEQLAPALVGNEEISEPERTQPPQKTIIKEILTCGSKTDLNESTVGACNNTQVPEMNQKRPGSPITHRDRKISRPIPGLFVIKALKEHNMLKEKFTSIKEQHSLRVTHGEPKEKSTSITEQHNLLATHHGELNEKSSSIDAGGCAPTGTSNKQLTVDHLEQTRAKLEQPLQDASGREIAELQRDLREVRAQNEEMCRKLNDAMSKLINYEERLKFLEVENVQKKMYTVQIENKQRLHNNIKDLKSIFIRVNGRNLQFVDITVK